MEPGGASRVYLVSPPLSRKSSDFIWYSTYLPTSLVSQRRHQDVRCFLNEYRDFHAH